MPSINLDKLNRILEAARAARLPVRDLSERIREARGEESRCRFVIENQIIGRAGAVPAEAAALLALPLDEAEKVGRATLVAHHVEPETFALLISSRASRLRMEAALGEAQARSDGLNEPLAALPDWLARHGFPNHVRGAFS